MQAHLLLFLLIVLVVDSGIARQATGMLPAPGAAISDSVRRNQRQLIHERLEAIGLNPSGKLTIFGEGLLEAQPSRASELGHALLPPNYKLGPGDLLGLYFLKAQREFQLPVLPEGKIYIPTAGLFDVTGLTLPAATELLREKLARFFDTRDFTLALLTPKTVMVEITGGVNRPGRYTMNGLQTVLDALLRAGGPTPFASLRNIHVQNVRGEKTHADLYTELLQIQPTLPLVLQAGDRIFVPPGRSWVAIMGEVHRPAIFELSENKFESLQDLLACAGGATREANLAEVEWSRLLPEGDRELSIINLEATNGIDSTQFRLQHGARVTIYSRLQKTYPRKVAIYGEVNAPGVYAYEESLRVNDLIQRAGGLTRSAYVLAAELARVEPGQSPTIEKIDLQELFPERGGGEAGLQNGGIIPATKVLLQEDDQLFIRSIPEWEVGPLIEIRGEVEFPGFYPIKRGVTTLSGIFNLAGGPTQEAALAEARLYRRSSRAQPIETSLPEALLQPSDREALRLEHSLAATKRISVDFQKLIIGKDVRHEVALEPGDIIEVPRQSQLVYVTGAVALPGGVMFQAGHKLDDYIAAAGGLGLNAARRRAKIIRSSGEILDDEEVKTLSAGDTIWVPTRGERTTWSVIREVITVTAQIAAIYLIIDSATK